AGTFDRLIIGKAAAEHHRLRARIVGLHEADDFCQPEIFKTQLRRELADPGRTAAPPMVGRQGIEKLNDFLPFMFGAADTAPPCERSGIEIAEEPDAETVFAPMRALSADKGFCRLGRPYAA